MLYRVTAEHNGRTTWSFYNDKKNAQKVADSNGGEIEVMVNSEWVSLDRWENEGGR